MDPHKILKIGEKYSKKDLSNLLEQPEDSYLSIFYFSFTNFERIKPNSKRSHVGIAKSV